MHLNSGFDHEELWTLIAKVVSDNASEEERLALQQQSINEPVIKNIVEELQAVWKVKQCNDLLESELAFHKLLKRIDREL